MTFTQLKCFIEVAEHLNFTEAARRLNIAQSGISYNISELEKELNVKLFTRNKKDVELSFAGEQLLEKVFSISSLKRDIEIIAKKVKDGIKGNLRIGYPFVPIVYRYIDIFSKFKDEHPLIDTSYDALAANEIAKQLGKHQLDIGFTRLETIPHNSAICWHSLYVDSLCIVVGKKHPLKDKDTVCVKDFDEDILLIAGRHYDPGWFDLALGTCIRESCSPEIIDRYSDVYSVLMTVEVGMGFTILPKCWKETLNNNLYFLDIEGDVQTEIGIAWHRDSDNESVKLFLNEFGVRTSGL